jgi:hypothetical protein
MTIKNTFTIIFFTLFVSGVFSQSISDTLNITDYFTFHNNKWMNLHHFLYEKASNEQESKLKEDGLKFLNIGEKEILAKLSKEERLILDQCISFYKDSIIPQELLHSERIFLWLIAQDENKIITDKKLSEGLTLTLNKMNNVYTTYFWSAHKEHNVQLLKNHVDLIEQIETNVINDMQRLSGAVWCKKVRVDITTYGNWAGAYSPANNHIVVSTIDPLMQTSIFIEFVFHEGSHLLFQRNSPFRKSLFETTKKLKMPYSRNLWHAAMFYLSGVSTKKQLNQLGVKHKLIMKEKRVFIKYYDNPLFCKILDEYFLGTNNRSETITNLLKL